MPNQCFPAAGSTSLWSSSSSKTRPSHGFLQRGQKLRHVPCGRRDAAHLHADEPAALQRERLRRRRACQRRQARVRGLRALAEFCRASLYQRSSAQRRPLRTFVTFGPDPLIHQQGRRHQRSTNGLTRLCSVARACHIVRQRQATARRAGHAEPAVAGVRTTPFRAA